MVHRLVTTAIALFVFSGCSRGEPTRVEPPPKPHPPPIAIDACGNAPTPPPHPPLPPDDQKEAGFRVFARTCVTCHQPSGRGLPDHFPPLAGSDFLMADEDRAIRIVLGGLEGPVTVNGQAYAASMPSHACLSDDEIADALTFVRNNWGNEAKPTTRAAVTAHRAEGTATVRLAAGR
jgi:mono/diheme cytochrome c family protein